MGNNIIKDFYSEFTKDELWLIEENPWVARLQNVRESWFTLGNGYLGIRGVLEEIPYNVFLAEANYIGYTPSGNLSERNELYRDVNRMPIEDDIDTILGQYNLFCSNLEEYTSNRNPDCIKKSVLNLLSLSNLNRQRRSLGWQRNPLRQ